MKARTVPVDERPPALLLLEEPLAELFVRGSLDAAGARVAIIGARDACSDALRYAFDLAFQVARGGGVVISGGAMGIDAAAHEGALAARRPTWLVAPCGSDHCFPATHRELYARVEAGGGALLFPFPENQRAGLGSFYRRNSVLAALADVVVVVQASIQSGTRNTVAFARRFHREIWAVPGVPWLAGFDGCTLELERGARPLASTAQFLDCWGLSGPPGEQSTATAGPERRTTARRGPATPEAPRGARPPLEPALEALLVCLDDQPSHLDEVAARAGLTISHTSTLLLTLALENVVVEHPPGFYRRSDGF